MTMLGMLFVRGLVVMLLVLVLAAYSRWRQNLEATHFVCALGLLLLVALPFSMLAPPLVNLGWIESADTAPHSADGTDDSVVRLAAVEHDRTGSIDRSENSTALPVEHGHEESLAAGTGIRSSLPWGTLAIMAWSIGAAGLILFSILGHVVAARRFRSTRTRALHESHDLDSETAARIRVSTEIRQPVTFGSLRPKIVVPDGFDQWPAEHQRAVIAHELAHVQRSDGLLAYVWQLVRALWWPNPLIWLCGRWLTEAREHLCDEMALRQGISPKTYARALLDVARNLENSPTKSAHSQLAMVHLSFLERRVRAVLGTASSSHRFGRTARSLAGLILVAATSTVTVLSPLEAQQDPRPEPLRVELRADQSIWHAGRSVTLEEWRGVVEQFSRSGGDAVLVEADTEATSARLVQLIDETKLGGVHSLRILTRSMPKVIRITLTKRARVLHQGKDLGLPGLGQLIARWAAERPTIVRLKADSDVPLHLAIDVTREAMSHGATSVELESETDAIPPPSPPIEEPELADTETAVSQAPIPWLEQELHLKWLGQTHCDRRLAEDWIRRDPQNAQAFLALAGECVVSGHFETAARLYDHLATDPEWELRALLAHARMELRLKRFGEALSLLRRAQELAPSENTARQIQNLEGWIGEGDAISRFDRPPVVIHQPSPVMNAQLRKAAPAQVEVVLRIDEYGRVQDVQVRKSTNALFEPAALEAARNWKFSPAIRGGKAVSHRAKFLISFPTG